MKFIYTNVLFMMLIPSLILMYLIITKQTSLNKYFSVEVLNKLSVSNQYLSNKARNIIMFLALLFFIIALARPVTNEKTINTTNEKTKPIIIALDVSKSMKANDIYPDRLTFAKNKLLNIIDYSKNNSLGVILFAKSSYILSPLTSDFKSLKILIKNLDTGANFDNGTNILSVIETSNKLLKQYKTKNLLIITDGGDNDSFEKEIQLANKLNIKTYILGTATKKGSAVKLKDGNFLTNKNGDIVNLKLNENIKELSLKTNAGYIDFSLSNEDFKEIINDINANSSDEITKEQKRKTYTELFYYPLFIGIFLLLIATSSMPKLLKNKTVLLLFSLCFISQGSLKAYEFDFEIIKNANENYKNKKYEDATTNYKKLESSPQRDYNLANSYYKDQKFNQAIKTYNNIKTENRDLEFQKNHNLGNAYAKANKLKEAIKSYENALKIKNDSQTKENLELIKKLLKQQKKKQENNKNSENKDNKKNKEENKKENNNKNKDNKNSKEKNKDQKKQQKEEKEKQNPRKTKNQISDYEEKKWLKQLDNQKTNPLLKKMKSSNEDSSTNPW